MLSVALGAEWWENSKAPLWDSADFANVIGGSKFVLVEFFTPWCHYCHMMAPEFEHFYSAFQEPTSADYRPDLLIGRVNAAVEQVLAYNNRVSSFPTILIFQPLEKDVKHRVEGYQRRYDLARLITHALPEKPRPIAVETTAPTHTPDPVHTTPPEVPAKETILPPNPSLFIPQEPAEFPIIAEPAIESEQTPDTQPADNHQFEEIVEPTYEAEVPEPVYEGEVLEPMEEEVLEPMEEEDRDIEVEYEIVYRDSAGAIKEELNQTYYRLLSSFQTMSETKDSSLLLLQDLLKELKALQREENLRASERFDKLEARLEELHLDVKQRNRLESAQTRLNMTHMLLFLGIGGLVGAAVSMLLTKVTDHKDRTKV
jgi:thiol-disulfide isomerase/thioredoxin